jgi:dTDP-4-dehydrorhamnose reductase
VLVIGSDGMLGREMVAGLRRAGYDTKGVPGDELDVLDLDACHEAVHAARPNVVIDCGAPGEDVTGPSIALGAGHAAQAARAVEAYSIYFSSPEVFAGDAEDAYLESDVPSPVTAIGAAKLQAETEVAKLNPRHAIVRTSWLFGDGSGPVDAVLAQAAQLDRVTVDAATTSSPTYMPHVVTAITALVRRPAYGIFHLASSGSCTQLHLARAVLRLVGSKATAVADVHAEGARNLALATRRHEVGPLPHWKIAVRTYLHATKRVATATGDR